MLKNSISQTIISEKPMALICLEEEHIELEQENENSENNISVLNEGASSATDVVEDSIDNRLLFLYIFTPFCWVNVPVNNG